MNALDKLFGKTVCAFTGHARMKRIGVAGQFSERQLGIATFVCSRCGHTETRKVYPRKPRVKKADK